MEARRSSPRPSGARSSSGTTGKPGDNMRPLRTAAVFIAAVTVVGAQAPNLEKDWPMHGRDAGAQRYSPLRQINTTNVASLRLIWSYDTPAAVPRGSAAAGQDE